MIRKTNEGSESFDCLSGDKKLNYLLKYHNFVSNDPTTNVRKLFIFLHNRITLVKCKTAKIVVFPKLIYFFFFLLNR